MIVEEVVSFSVSVGVLVPCISIIGITLFDVSVYRFSVLIPTSVNPGIFSMVDYGSLFEKTNLTRLP